MSCPSCQVGGRRLPVLPLGYLAKSRKQTGFKNNELCSKSFSSGLGPYCTHSPPLEDHIGLMEYLQQHPNVIEEYVLKHVSQSQIEKWIIRKSLTSAPHSSTTASKKSLSQWKFCVHKDKRQLLQKLTNEIQIGDKKYHVINELTKSTAEAIYSTRHTFYTLDDSHKYLTCYSESSSRLNSPIKIEISSSKTVAGFVARSKEPVFVPDVLGDDRFPDATGRHGTDLSIICFPIHLSNGDLFGVVEFVRDESSIPFEIEDMEITSSYLAWCEIAIQYADVAGQVYSHTSIEKFINEFGLMLTETDKGTEEMYLFLMEFAKNVTNCENYILYNLDESTKELKSIATSFKSKSEDGSMLNFKTPSDQGIAGHALNKNIPINVKDAYSNPHFSRHIDQETGITTKTILATSFGGLDGSRGVLELSNKIEGAFTDQDITVIELCKTYCSLIMGFKDLIGEVNIMQKEVAVLRDGLVYQNRPTKKQLKLTEFPQIPVEVPEDLYTINFNMYRHSDHFGSWFMLLAKDLFGRCNLKYSDRTLLKFTTTVKNMYHEFPYHNWEHAFSVAQFVLVLLESVWDEFKPLERIGLFIGAVCHDVDHRGVNNAFLLKTEHPLGHLYASGSALENHHSYMTDLILEQKDCDIFASLNKEEKKEVKSYITKIILSTDLFTHFDRKTKMDTILMEKKFSWKDEQHRHMASMVMMTISDLCGSCKTWEVHRLSATKVFEEFFRQGEIELALGYEPLRMFVNREDFPLNQVGFLNGILKPAVDTMLPIVPVLHVAQQNIVSNISRWEEIIANSNETSGQEDAEILEQKIKELRIPNSELQKRSLSFVMYNCANDHGERVRSEKNSRLKNKYSK